jgi:predicted ester cyclase
VVNRWTFRGTHRGEFAGIPATGKAVSMSVTTIYRISDGQVVDLWENYDALGLLQQLGAVPAPGQSAP